MKGADPDMLETAGKRKELVRAVGAYIRAKKKAGRIDFGDQISKAVQVLEGNDEVRDGYRRRFPFVLLEDPFDDVIALLVLVHHRDQPRRLTGPDVSFGGTLSRQLRGGWVLGLGGRHDARSERTFQATSARFAAWSCSLVRPKRRSRAR